MIIELPFPPAILSGHANGNGTWGKIATTKQFRGWAKRATEAAGGCEVPPTGDVRIHFHFVPPDNRSDRLNFANRVKPIADGIAEAIGINDKRFLPSYSYADACKPGKVVVTVGEME